MRKALLYVHLWSGLTAAVFLLLLGVSGAVIAFENELDRALNAKLCYVQPQGQPLTLDAITQRLLAAYPGAKIEGFEPPQRPNQALFVGLIDASGKDFQLFVDPYTGAVVGSADQLNRFVSRVHQFHTHLLGGEIGKQIVGWSGVLLLLLSITGIILWWPAKLFRIRWSSSGKRFNFELHNTIGVTSSLFLFVFAVTSVCIHWERQVGNLAQQMSSTKDVRPIPPQIPAPGTPMLSADRLMEIARTSLPGAKIMALQFPENPRQPAQVALRFPEDHTPLGRTRLRVDAYSGKVLLVQSSRDMSAPMKYARMWNREIHTGDILNLPTRILAAFFSLMLPVLAISGPVIWWNRRKVSERKPLAVVASARNA